jgi:hypothetical protein
LVTTIIGISVTAAWKGYRYAFKGRRSEEELPVRDFADRLAYELLHNNFATDNESSIAMSLLPLKLPRRSPRLIDKTHGSNTVRDINCNLVVKLSETAVSPLTSTNNSSARM